VFIFRFSGNDLIAILDSLPLVEKTPSLRTMLTNRWHTLTIYG